MSPSHRFYGIREQEHLFLGIKQANMGNNGTSFWASSEQHKSFKDQENLSLKHIMVKVSLLIGNKGYRQIIFQLYSPEEPNVQ